MELAPSRLHVRAGGGRDGAEDEVAVASFPPVAYADVLYVHTDPATGLLAVEGELLSAKEFHARVLVPGGLERGQPPRQLLVMVSCGLGADRPGPVEAAAQVLARLGDRPVLAASADVFTTPAGVVEVRETGVDLKGRPLLIRRQAGWRLHVPGGAEPVPFGQDLAAVLDDRELAEKLPDGTPVPEVGQHPEPVRFPAREVRWAMGAEIERRNVGLLLPAGQNWPRKVVLVQSRDEFVKIVVDHARAWRGANGVLYETEEDMKRAGAAPHPEQADRGGEFDLAVPEMVAGPWQVGAKPGRPALTAVLDRIRGIERRWEQVLGIQRASGRWPTLAELFEDPEEQGEPQYDVSTAFRDVQAAFYPQLFGDAPLFVQLSVGVPVGGGLLAALEELERSITVRSPIKAEAVHGAMRFGWQVASLYLADTTGDAQLLEDVTALTPDRDVVSVVEVMALAFIQLSAVLRDLASSEDFPKKFMAAVARQSLAEIWGELSPQVQPFLAQRTDRIRQLFEAEFRTRFPGFTHKYNHRHRLPEGERVELWDLEFSNAVTKAHVGTVRDLFNENVPGSAQKFSESRLRIPVTAWTPRAAAHCRWWCWKCGPTTARSTSRQGCGAR